MTDTDNFMGEAVFVDCVDPESSNMPCIRSQMGFQSQCTLWYNNFDHYWENEDPRPGNGCKNEF